MGSVVRGTGGNLGVYAIVESPGVVRPGDAVELLEAVPGLDGQDPREGFAGQLTIRFGFMPEQPSCLAAVEQRPV